MPFQIHAAVISATAAMLALGPSDGVAQDAPLKVSGRCERLVIGAQDITQNCKEQLVRTVVRGRTTFDFAAWDGQFLSFSGEEAGAPLPVTLVVPGRRDKDSIVRNPAPATGACTLSTPEAGKTQIACEANAQGKSYVGTFVTDAPLPAAAAKP